MPGMRKSQTNRSGGSSTALSRASAASFAVETLPSGASAPFSIPRIMGLSSTSRTLTLFDMQLFLLANADEVAALSASLMFKRDFANFDALVERLAHIVHGERGNAHGGQRFHLHSRCGRGCDL